MMPFSRGRRGEMGLCIRQQSIPEKLIPPEAENGREQKKRGKSEDGPVHDPGAVIRNILFRKRILQFPVAGGAETEAGSSD